MYLLDLSLAAALLEDYSSILWNHTAFFLFYEARSQ
jgi:hypothetical protein